jgi:fibronectin type 3 domain-containing protein
MIDNRLLCAAALSWFAVGAFAAELKVDINNNNRPVNEGLDPSYVSWNDVSTWFTSGANSISKTFSGVTVTLTRVGGVSTGLEPGYNKANVQSPTLNVKLTADGIKVADGDAGAQIEMRIAGLSAGAHTLAVYHNSWNNIASLAPVNVFVDGTQVATNVPTSINVTDNLAAGISYLTFTALAGQDVVVLFAARTSGAEVSKNVYINGFEIDTPNPKKLARNPSPANADEHVNADSKSQTLGWTTAFDGTAVSHDVYFGTSSSAVINATHASPEFKGNQLGANYLVTNLNSLLTYYWRIDEVDNVGGVTKGNLWYFRPRQLAFPGAEGYGRFARGGRGGAVVKVTNLNDSGPGSFRDAIEGNYGPRTIIFDVSGQIVLNDDVILNGTMPPITVAGQTAPGKGVCFRRQQFALSGAEDAIVRYVRVRVGKESGETQNGSGMAGVDHCIMDHCSVSWGIDEEISSRGAKNMTLQRTFISEALNIAGHQNYPPGDAHGYAASIGGDIASFHHNLLAHCAGRNWSLAGGLDADGNFAGRLDIFNNVVYNWDGRTTDGGAHEVNFVHNYYKPGPAISNTKILTAQYENFPGTQRYYYTNNVMPGYHDASDLTSRNYTGTPQGYSPWVDAPFFPSYAIIDEVTNAYKKVLSDVGCNQPQIDDHDARVIRETLDKTYTYSGSVSGLPGLPDTTADVGGWENYGNEVRAVHFDTDNDGMPNWWEVIKGFNTNSAVGDFAESNSDLDGDGFTALEDYLNWMAEPHADCDAGGTVDIDLHALSRGFTNASPSYTFSNLVSGTVTLVSNRFARFAPATGASALGQFLYKVTDNKGYNMSRPINIRIIGGASPTNAPAIPAGLNATAGEAQVSLSWNVTSDATSYIVKRSTVNGGPYTSVVTNASTGYVNTGLVNGTTYYYVVSALNAVGESADSAQVSATPQLAPPSVPLGLNAVAGNAQVALNWSTAAGATSYIVKRSTTSGSGYVSIVTNATTTYTNTSLANGTTYHYVVSGLNAAGESANSSQASATPQIPAPTGLSAVAGDSQIALSWNASAGATSYIVKRATIGGGPYTSLITNVTTVYTNVGLANGVTYYYVISALGADGQSANTAQVSATPVGTGSSALFAYEGFNYTANTSIANQSGGTGWGATWGNAADAASALATNVAGGLTYGSGAMQLVTSGGALVVGNPYGTSSTTVQTQRQLSNTLANIAGGNPVWISFLYQNLQSDKGSLAGFRETGIRLMSGATTNAAGYSNRNGTDKLDAGSPNTYPSGAGFDEMSLFVAPTYVHNGFATPRGTNATNVVFVVMRLNVDNTTNVDAAYAWFFQNGNGLGGEPGTGSALVFTNADVSGVNALRFQAGNANANGSNAVWTLDEIRMGGTYADVAPTSGSTVASPILGIRNEGGTLKLELTAQAGTSNIVQTVVDPNNAWSNWTNVIGTGSLQLLPLNGLTDQPTRFFRALSQ